jgi:hypothetical protein
VLLAEPDLPWRSEDSPSPSSYQGMAWGSQLFITITGLFRAAASSLGWKLSFSWLMDQFTGREAACGSWQAIDGLNPTGWFTSLTPYCP